MSEDYTPGIIAWFDASSMKGMALDVDVNVYPFDSRNIGDLLPSEIHETHIVAMQLRWRNGRGLIESLAHPTREEAGEFGDRLRDAYNTNAMAQALRKAERRSVGLYSSCR